VQLRGRSLGSSELLPHTPNTSPSLSLSPPLPPVFIHPEKLEDYLNKWSWDVERFDGEDPLPDLARRLQTIADKIDVDIRGFLSSYTEKKQTLAALARRQT
jgi:hypothetical protein